MERKDLIAGFVFDNYLNKGNFSFSMDEIAQNLNMSKKTIYKHFSSREEMLEYCIQGFFAELESRFSKLSRRPFSTEQEFRELIHDWFAVITDITSSFDLSALDRIQYRYPDFWKIMNTNRERLVNNYFLKVLKKAADLGLVKNEIPVPLLVKAVINLITDLAVPEIIIQHGGVQVFIQFVASMILDGILKRDTHSAGKSRNNKDYGGRK